MSNVPTIQPGECEANCHGGFDRDTAELERCLSYCSRKNLTESYRSTQRLNKQAVSGKGTGIAKILIVILIIVLLAAGGYILLKKSPTAASVYYF